jgi:hypothetical protein
VYCEVNTELSCMVQAEVLKLQKLMVGSVGREASKIEASVSNKQNTVESGYNDIGLYDTLPVVRYSVVPINSSLLTVTLYSSVITIQNMKSLLWHYNRIRPC